MKGRAAILVGLIVLVVAPIALAPRAGVEGEGRRLIIVTPHNELIRYEFGRAFEAWHEQTFGERVHVVWSVPGGTSEIQRMLEAQFRGALAAGEPVGGTADLFFGGGTYIHDQLKREIAVTVEGKRRTTTLSAPVPFDDAWLRERYGAGVIGEAPLYDEDKHWFGTAVSGFGIVYNRDVLADLGAPEPRTWEDLCDPLLRGWVVLTNPAQSGSVTTAFENVIQHRGWLPGWRILRRAGANSQAFTASSIKAPLTVGLGDAAAAVCIDFFGRSQAQALLDAGAGDRVRYVDPAGGTTIDPDPISLLRGAPQPELARRFIEFCLSEAGQALWQFPAGAGGDLGPRRYELRRMPIMRSMYEQHFDRFVDRVDPYRLARPGGLAHPDARRFVAVLFVAMNIDSHDEQRRAWEAIVTHPAYGDRHGIVTADDLEDPGLRRMLELFDAMPSSPGPDGDPLPLADDANLPAIRQGWATPGLWPPHADPVEETRRRFVRFFRGNYARVVELGAAR